MRRNISGTWRTIRMVFSLRSSHSDYDHRHSDISGDILRKSDWQGAALAIVMTIGTLSFLVTTPECGCPTWEAGARLSVADRAGRLVIKDTAILAGAIVVLSDSAKEY